MDQVDLVDQHLDQVVLDNPVVLVVLAVQVVLVDLVDLELLVGQKVL